MSNLVPLVAEAAREAATESLKKAIIAVALLTLAVFAGMSYWTAQSLHVPVLVAGGLGLVAIALVDQARRLVVRGLISLEARQHRIQMYALHEVLAPEDRTKVLLVTGPGARPSSETDRLVAACLLTLATDEARRSPEARTYGPHYAWDRGITARSALRAAVRRVLGWRKHRRTVARVGRCVVSS